jgi:hypothetical protein
MVARKVAALLKPNALTEFTNLMEYEILPWLRTQEGFLGLITLAVPGSREVAAISFWDCEADAETYHIGGYPQALEILEKLLDAAPYVKTFDVVGSTFQRPARGEKRKSQSKRLDHDLVIAPIRQASDEI